MSQESLHRKTSKLYPCLLLIMSVVLLAGVSSAYESLQGPTELLFHNKEKAYNGYTLFSSRGAWLIDMQGRVVHTWKIGTNPRLLDNGHLLDELGTVKTMPDSLPMTNSVFRAYRYGPDHPALKGKDLTPKGTITDAFAMKADTRQPPGQGQGQKHGGQGQRRGGQGRQGNRQGNQDSNNSRRGGRQQ